MFRTLIIVAAALLVFLIIKKSFTGRSLQRRRPSAATTEKMVQCVQCETYIPRKEAIISGTDTFCCRQHQRDWELDHQDST